jgi:hypothetical protein
MPSCENADRIITELINEWCVRRALGPLRYVLPSWPHNGLTDGIAECLESLRAARALSGNQITTEEKDKLSQAIAILTQAVYGH